MAIDTRKGTGLLPVLVVVALLLIFNGKLRDIGSDLLGGITGHDTEIIGNGDGQVMVAGRAASRVKQCTTQELLGQRKCDDLKIVIIDAAKIPFIARNIQLAWGEGKEFLLHKDAPYSDQPKRDAVCGPRVFKAHYENGSCDEYPMASTKEGGRPSKVRIEEVPLREQKCQGGTLRQEYRRAQIGEGDSFIVVIRNPRDIADVPYAGTDIGKDQSCLG